MALSSILPPPLFHLAPIAAQLAMVMAVYVLHLLVLSKSSWSFPVQLIPNDKGMVLEKGGGQGEI